jgi:hypothetical protein
LEGIDAGDIRPEAFQIRGDLLPEQGIVLDDDDAKAS